MLTAILTIVGCLVGIAGIAAFILYVVPYIISFYTWAYDAIFAIFNYFPVWVYPIFFAGVTLAVVSIIVKVV